MTPKLTAAVALSLATILSPVLATAQTAPPAEAAARTNIDGQNLREANTQRLSAQGGKAVFDSLCAVCHLPGGGGAPGVYPALAKNPRLAAAAYPLSLVLNGQKAMPAFGRMLSDDQISDVVNYVRSNFGNTYKPTTTPADVKAMRR